VWAAGALVLAALRPGGALAQEPPNAGLVLQVPASITTETTNRVRTALYGPLKRFEDVRQRDPKKAGAFKVVLDFNPDDHRRSSSEDFGACYELAKYLRSLQQEGIQTVAFVHGSVTRHSVLPVLACDEVFLSADPPSLIGKVVDQGKALDRVERVAYEEVVRNRKPPLAIVRKMFDRDVAVIKVPPGDKQGDRYRDANDNSRPRGEPVPGLGAGDTALYTFAQARDFGLCQQAPRDNLDEVLEACALPRSSLYQSLERTVAWRVVVAGTLNGELKEKVQRRIKRALGHGANLLILQLECGDGSDQTAYELGLFLARLNEGRRDKPVQTVAFVTGQARNTATFLALGCNKIVMQGEVKQGDTVTRQGARLGDFDRYVQDHPSLEALRPDGARRRGPEGAPDRQALQRRYEEERAGLEVALRKNLADLATKQHYPVLLAEGMLSRDLRIHRVASARGGGVRKFLSGEEFDADQAGERGWRSLEMVKPATKADEGKYLTLSAEAAEKLGVAQEVTGWDKVCELEGVSPGEVHLADADWLDELADFLRDPWVSIILVMLGITCLILELKMPGVGVPGVVAAVCFVLFFWSHSQLNGQITWLAMLLFVLGLLLIGLEVFVLPGFGVCGISGILLVLVSLGLVAYGHWPRSQEEWVGFGQKLGPFSLSLLGALVAAFILARYLPNIPFANRLMLKPLDEPGEGGEEEAPGAQPEHAALLGAIGVAATPLRPAGKSQFGDEFIDVVAEGGYVMPGTRVQVIEIEGNRIVVKEV
jgi:membrane-bound ClpP family serine protease